jgi:mono/diheme cytochrome c family protein
MKSCLLATSLFGLIFSASAFAETPLERGKYLVEEVGKCGECHTPKVDGKPDESKLLKGAVLNFAPIEPVEGWHKTSPDLTSTARLWTRWKDEGMLKYLQTGLGPNGKPAEAPMPAYKLKPEDADAIVQYLKSLQ